MEDWPDPMPEMLESPLFERVWQTIKTWDVNVPSVYDGYCGATGNHVRAICEAVAGPYGRCSCEYAAQCHGGGEWSCVCRHVTP